MSIADWTRWMHASVCLYMKSVADSNSVPSLAEGLEERTQTFMQASDRIEVRVNGPYTKKHVGLYEARLYVNVLVTSNMGDAKNAFALDNILGWVHEAMDAEIPLIRTGSASDDQVQIGCLKVINDLKVFNFGQLTSEDRVRQGLVTAAYLYHFER